MKKILLIITVSLTLFLTGCNTTEKKLQDVLDQYVNFIDVVMTNQNVDFEKECQRLFAGEDAQTCVNDFNPEEEIEVPYFYELSMTLIEFKEFTHDDFSVYSEVYIVTFEASIKIQYKEDTELLTNVSEESVFIVKDESSFKLLMLNPADYE